MPQQQVKSMTQKAEELEKQLVRQNNFLRSLTIKLLMTASPCARKKKKKNLEMRAKEK